MDLPIFNLTSEDISVLYIGLHDAKPTVVPAASHTSLTLTHRPHWHYGLTLRAESEKSRRYCELSAGKLKLKARRTWALVSDEWDGRIPWRIYLSRDLNKHERKLIILPKRDMSCFLTDLEDERPLSDLCLPGTHDALALYGWPVSQCQSINTPLTVQLHSGVRVLDVRLAVVDGHLIAYHGAFPQKTSFQTVLSDIYTFLTAPSTSRETVVMSIKQEDFAKTPPPTFSALVHAEIFSGPGGRDMWFLENRVPQLGEVRGKVVMLSRFGGDGTGWENGLEGLGIHPTTWPDSAREGFEWRCKNTVVRTHDWYNIPSFLSIPEKVYLATAFLMQPTKADLITPILNITYFSAGSFPFALPSTVARGFGWPEWGMGVEGVNSRAGRWLLDQLSASQLAESRRWRWKSTTAADARPLIRGWAFMDFFEVPENLAPLFIEFNFINV